jgi:hypothetical protein
MTNKIDIFERESLGKRDFSQYEPNLAGNNTGIGENTHEELFEEGVLSDDSGDMIPFETTAVSSTTYMVSSQTNRVDPLGPTICGIEEYTSEPKDLLRSGEWQRIKVAADERPSAQQVETGLLKTDLLYLLPSESEKLDKDSFSIKLGEYFSVIMDEIQRGMSFEGATKEIEENVLNPFQDYLRNPRLSRENLSLLFTVFSILANEYQSESFDTYSNILIFKYHRNVLLPVVLKVRELLGNKIHKLKDIEEVLLEVKTEFQKQSEKIKEDKLVYDYSKARNFDEIRFIVIEQLKEHAYFLLVDQKTPDKCVDIIKSCHERTITSTENNDIKKNLGELQSKIIDIVKAQNDKLNNNRHKRNARKRRLADERGNGIMHTVEVTVKVKKEKSPVVQRKASLWKRVMSFSALLFTLTASVFITKDSCNSRDDSNSDLIMLKSDQDATSDLDANREIDEERGKMAKGEEDVVAVSKDEFDFTNEDSAQVVASAKGVDEEINLGDDDFDFTGETDSDFDFTLDSVRRSIERTFALSTLQYTVESGDGMSKYLKIWREKMNMRNVAFPEYFDDFNDFEIMTALAIFSDAEAKRLGDSSYKNISQNLMLRRGRNVYIPEDASPILAILTGNISANTEEAIIMQGMGLKEYYKTITAPNYEAWRGPMRGGLVASIHENVPMGNAVSQNETRSMDDNESKKTIDIDWDEIDSAWDFDETENGIENGFALAKGNNAENSSEKNAEPLDDEMLIPIDIDDEWAEEEQEIIELDDEDIIPIEVDEMADVLDDETLIPIDIDDEWAEEEQEIIELDDEDIIPIEVDEMADVLDDETLIPIDIDDEWAEEEQEIIELDDEDIIPIEVDEMADVLDDETLIPINIDDEWADIERRI